MTGHYMTTVPDGCTCFYTEQRIPGEPHIPSYLDAEPDPWCSVHFTDLDHANYVIEILFILAIDGSVQGADQADHALQVEEDGDGWNEPRSEVWTCLCETWDGIEWTQTDPECTGRPDKSASTREWIHHVWPRPVTERG